MRGAALVLVSRSARNDKPRRFETRPFPARYAPPCGGSGSIRRIPKPGRQRMQRAVLSTLTEEASPGISLIRDGSPRYGRAPGFLRAEKASCVDRVARRVTGTLSLLRAPRTAGMRPGSRSNFGGATGLRLLRHAFIAS